MPRLAVSSRGAAAEPDVVEDAVAGVAPTVATRELTAVAAAVVEGATTDAAEGLAGTAAAILPFPDIPT